MTGIILLFSLGLVLFFFEVFVPGAVLGILGGILMAIGCGIAFHEFGLNGGALASALAIFLVGLMLYVELILLPKTRFGKRLFLDTAVSATSQPPPAQIADVVGQAGEALTTLAPGGFVLVAGRKYEAASQSGLLPKGAAVKVTGLDNFRLLVSKP
ncbi:MAG: serine protease [Opitutus sp.]|nr:serine protease [Opitutus sp.]